MTYHEKYAYPPQFPVKFAAKIFIHPVTLERFYIQRSIDPTTGKLVSVRIKLEGSHAREKTAS